MLAAPGPAAVIDYNRRWVSLALGFAVGGRRGLVRGGRPLIAAPCLVPSSTASTVWEAGILNPSLRLGGSLFASAS